MRVNPLWLPTLEGHRYAEPSAREKVLLDKLEDVTARFEKATEALELIKDELAKYVPAEIPLGHVTNATPDTYHLVTRLTLLPMKMPWR